MIILRLSNLLRKVDRLLSLNKKFQERKTNRIIQFSPRQIETKEAGGKVMFQATSWLELEMNNRCILQHCIACMKFAFIISISSSLPGQEEDVKLH